ncbi:amino acid adenylation domain-containing protein [Streptomyces sp. NPDC058195]|uniref:amino acid adenylation domain-containing protein n=1 Tax=Streptomyces sp. NPDC058195 TaxID=3346375 RepID=UPI0036E7B48A
MRTLDRIVARQAAASPDRIAVDAPDAQLTYAALEARSDRLAHRLRALRGDDDRPVGVCLERSATLIVSLLAVLKAGRGYLALDPRQPPQRLAELLRDAGCDLVITQRALVGRIGTDVTTLVVDAPADDPAGDPDGEGAARAVPRPATTGSSTAYIAYTSGSTGRPKGVCTPHRAVIRLVLGNRALPLRADDVFLQFAPAAFDASTLEIWGPLLNGGRLVVAPPGDLSPAEISALVRKEGVTVLWLTAGLFHAMVESGTADLSGVRYLLAGGDTLSPGHVDRALRELPGTTLVNGYGPTENTTFTTCHPLTAATGGGTVPIGRPIDHTAVHVLDERLAPVPDGEVGELYASGLGLAHGYLHHAGQTAERFVANPFGPPGERMYRTGDLVSRRPDGVLLFHGRADDQVKIRGFRVEPSEVETALRRHPEITDAAVAVRGKPGADRHLAAFYVGSQALPAGELRHHLGALLPDHMIPAAFVRLDPLPLTASGKVDRAALADVSLPGRPELSTPYRGPDDGVEGWLAELWADLLELSEVGVDDDFFELGGHSLMAARITSEISVEYDVTVPALTFYQRPTVCELAEFITAARRETEARV